MGVSLPLLILPPPVPLSPYLSRSLSLRLKLAPDLEPWWQVDLGAAKTIGTIRVWNRQQEPNVDEIQIVTIAGPHLRSQLGGFFQLRFRTTTTLYVETQPHTFMLGDVFLGDVYSTRSISALTHMFSPPLMINTDAYAFPRIVNMGLG